MRARDMPAMDRLLARLEPQPNGCWHWLGIIDKAGYGRTGYKGRRSETIQRAVYDCFVGEIPPGMHIDHDCHTKDSECMRLGADCMHRRCGNPEHLKLVTAAENSRLSKARVHQCPRGHSYDAEGNTYTHKGHRFCVACQREAGSRYKARIRVER